MEKRRCLPHVKTACITHAVCVSEIFGVETSHRHLEFLERAQEVGLIVIPGFTTNIACDDFDCYQLWYDAATDALKLEYLSGSAWHTTIRMKVLSDRPDALSFQGTVRPLAIPIIEAGRRRHE